jgi:PTS system fructose-specific IIC component/PTS system nitrogen regulatory IIA component
MELVDVFSPAYIKCGMEAEDKDEAFEELIDTYCSASGNKDRDELLQSVKDRESKMSTGIRCGIAIPHGKTNAVDKLCGVLGISTNGVDYDALDGKPVKLFFLMLAPERDTEEHLRLLKRLAELLDQDNFYQEMSTQTTPEGAFAVLKRYESQLEAV